MFPLPCSYLIPVTSRLFIFIGRLHPTSVFVIVYAETPPDVIYIEVLVTGMETEEDPLTIVES